MKKISYFLLSLAAITGAANMHAQTSADKMSEAVMGVYEKLLKEDSNDYETYFRRAGEFYRRNQYLRALSDIDKALGLTPETEKELRFQELCLRSNIYQMTDRKKDALSDLNAANVIKADDYSIVYLKANLEYELGDYTAAKNDYRKLLRLNSRSVEALVGLSRVAIKERNLGLANDYINQAVDLDRNSSEIYVRRATVRRELENLNGAVEDLLVAISLDSSNSRAFRLLTEIGRENYPAVISGISTVISQVPEQGMFYYIRANVAQDHFHFVQALDDYRHIVAENLYDYPGIYRSMAECYLALDRNDEALENINKAISMENRAGVSNVVKSNILRSSGRFEEAVEEADKALSVNGDDTRAMVAKGLAMAAMKNYEKASALFGEASLVNPSKPEYFMLRAWIQYDFLRQSSAADEFYRRVTELEIPDDNVYSLKGFALLFTGKEQDATTWIENILSKDSDSDGGVNYYGACFYSLTGDHDRAFECLEKSLQLGFGDKRLLKDCDEGRINLSSLRSEPQFDEMMERFSSNFTIE